MTKEEMLKLIKEKILGKELFTRSGKLVIVNGVGVINLGTSVNPDYQITVIPACVNRKLNWKYRPNVIVRNHPATDFLIDDQNVVPGLAFNNSVRVKERDCRNHSEFVRILAKGIFRVLDDEKLGTRIDQVIFQTRPVSSNHIFNFNNIFI